MEQGTGWESLLPSSRPAESFAPNGSGSRRTEPRAAVKSAGQMNGGFADSQRAGLSAMVDLAGSRAPHGPLPDVLGNPHRNPREAPAPNSLPAPATHLPPSGEPKVLNLPASPDAEQRHGWARRAIRRCFDFLYVPGLSLLVILTVQAVLSLHLVWTNTAFTDEALYLWAGHLEWSHWLHGTPIPPFPSYFSGAPFIYPPLGALADSVGGLAGARILSLCFMLGATSLLWATATRLYGRRAGLFAAGLWAFLAPTLKLGAFATFDPMSLFLLALSVWCAVRGAERDFTRWIVASAAALILANVATYSSAIFDPAVVTITLLTARPEQSLKLAKMRAAALAAYVVSVLILLIDAGRGFYWAGISQTVLSRTPGTDPPSTVYFEAWRWTAPVAVVAGAALLICAVTERRRSQYALLVLLVGVLMLVPLEQARLHTVTSLDKHIDFGAWFAAIAAGYVASKLSQLRLSATTRVVAIAACTAGLAVPIASGFAEAQVLYGWPNSQPFVAAFGPMAKGTAGPLLVEAPAPVRYYLGSAVQWERWSSTYAITLPDGNSIGSSGVTSPGRPSAYIRRINDGFFALVALNSSTTPALDRRITEAMVRSHRYRLVKWVRYDAIYYAGYYAIWRRQAAAGAG
jgi:hypothetical protein